MNFISFNNNNLQNIFNKNLTLSEKMIIFKVYNTKK